MIMEPQPNEAQETPEIEVTHPPKGTIVGSTCGHSAMLWHKVADGKGGTKDVFVGLNSASKQCSATVTPGMVQAHIQHYSDLTYNTNMLTKAEAKAISAMLINYSSHFNHIETVIETSDGPWLISNAGNRKMTFWETVKWNLFGAPPNARKTNYAIKTLLTNAGAKTTISDVK